MKAADPNADQLASEQAQQDARSLRTAALQVLQATGMAEVPAGLLTTEERQQVWAIFTHAAMRVVEAATRPVAPGQPSWSLVLPHSRLVVGSVRPLSDGTYDAFVVVGEEEHARVCEDLVAAKTWARGLRVAADRDPGEWVGGSGEVDRG